MTNENFLPGIEVRENETLKNHSTFRIGGIAKYAVFPKNSNELINSVKQLKENNIKYYIIGRGSNILFSDNNFDGAVIFTVNMTNTEYIKTENGYDITVSCGRSLTELANEVYSAYSLAGLEFAYGIPGTVGGAAFMNAGAYGGQMSDIIIDCTYYDSENDIVQTRDVNALEFGYRQSLFSNNKSYIVLSCKLRLKTGDKDSIGKIMKQNIQSRRDKQPLTYPSAGSTFKRPGNNIFAGKLIEDAGLKGYTVGGACVSEKHAGFIINKDSASSQDVLNLIEYVKAKVYENTGIKLDCEVIYIGD